MRNRITELIKYAVCGVITSAFNLAVFYGMVYVGINYLVANVLSYALAVVFSYVLNEKYVFTVEHTRSRIVRYILLRVASVAVDSLLLYVFVSILNGDVVISKLVVSLIVILGTYVINKLFVFAKAKEEGESEEK